MVISGALPPGGMGEARSKGFYDHQDDDQDHDHGRNFIDHAIKLRGSADFVALQPFALSPVH